MSPLTPQLLDTCGLFDLHQMYELGKVRRLDLGSGPKPLDGYLGLDVCAAASGRRVLPFDVCSGLPWPFESGTIEQLHSSHFIEHVPASDVWAYEFVGSDGESPSNAPTHYARSRGRMDALAWVMEEAYRVAQPGAHFRLVWPALFDPRTGRTSMIAFLDPTHRRFIPLEQLTYFQAHGRAVLGVEQYGYRSDWQILDVQHHALGSGDEVYGSEWDVQLRKPEAPA